MKIFKDYKKITIWGHLWPDLLQTVCKSVLKCNRTSHGRKRAARTHIAHTFQSAFRTRASVRARVRVRISFRNSQIGNECAKQFFAQWRTKNFEKKKIVTLELMLN